MNMLFKKIFTNELNFDLLKFLDINIDTKYFKTGEEAGSGFDSGSQTFFNDYGKLLPNEAKVSLSIYNLLVNPNSGEIFAFQWGRFTFLLKCDFGKLDLLPFPSRLKSITLDGEVDFVHLGKAWTLVDVKFSGKEEQHFLYAYELSYLNEGR